MKVLVILGSVRPGRKADRVAKWLENELKNDGRFESEIIDPANLELPFYNEEMSPFAMASNNKDYTNPKGREWANKVASAQAFILVTPEYNHGYSATLKNTLDWVGPEWKNKPAMVVSYSWQSTGGSRAAEQLRQVLPEIGLIGTTRFVNISTLTDKIDENGVNNDDGLKQYLAQAINELSDLTNRLQ